jgi:membrane protein implicated in regulation of membrane protease activity
MDTLQTVFVVCAVVGGVLFAFRLILQFMGADTDVAEMPDDIPDGSALGDGALADSDVSFRIISFQGVMSFLLMFGVVGLCMPRDTANHDVRAVVLAVGAGVATMVIQARIMTFLLRLQQSGTLKMADAIGKVGTVYLSIPVEGTGKVQIVVGSSLRIFDATAKGREEIPTGERIRVVELAGGSTVIVEKVADA